MSNILELLERLTQEMAEIKRALKWPLVEQDAPMYAEIYVHDASTAQSIASGATYTKSTAWTTNGVQKNCTADAANDKITFRHTGHYFVSGSFSIASGTANVNVLGSVFLDGTEIDKIHWRRKIGTANDEGVTAFSGIIDVDAVGEDLDFRMRHDNGSAVNITITYANLSVHYIGPN